MKSKDSDVPLPAVTALGKEKLKEFNENHSKTTAEGRSLLKKLGSAVANQSSYRPDRYVSNREKANRKYQSTESRRQMLLAQAELLMEKERNEKSTETTDKKAEQGQQRQQTTEDKLILFALQYSNRDYDSE